MSTLRVAVAQILSGADPEENLEVVAAQTAEAAAQGAQLVVFPEATMRRFGLPLADIAEPVDGPWSQQLRKIAEHDQVVVVAGMFTPGGASRVRNTLRAVGPGVDAYYDKIHLFDAFGFRESDTVAPGAEPVMITVGGTNVGLTTCYDVRFPGLYVRLAELGADVICVAASWGAGPGKVEQWQLLTRARGLDATSYLVAAGQADPAAAEFALDGRSERSEQSNPGSRAAVLRRSEGTRSSFPSDDEVGGLQSAIRSERSEQSNPGSQSNAAPTGVGYSAVISPRGEVLQSLSAEPGLLVADLDLDVVAETRAAIPVLTNRRF
jgi:predicted amidohydrolase